MCGHPNDKKKRADIDADMDNTSSVLVIHFLNDKNLLHDKWEPATYSVLLPVWLHMLVTWHSAIQRTPNRVLIHGKARVTRNVQIRRFKAMQHNAQRSSLAPLPSLWWSSIQVPMSAAALSQGVHFYLFNHFKILQPQ